MVNCVNHSAKTFHIYHRSSCYVHCYSKHSCHEDTTVTVSSVFLIRSTCSYDNVHDCHMCSYRFPFSHECDRCMLMCMYGYIHEGHCCLQILMRDAARDYRGQKGRCQVDAFKVSTFYAPKGREYHKSVPWHGNIRATLRPQVQLRYEDIGWVLIPHQRMITRKLHVRIWMSTR